MGYFWCLKLNLKLWVLTVYSYLRPIHAVSLQFFYNLYSGISGSPELTADYDKWCLVFVNWLTYRHIIVFVWCVLLCSWCKWINQNLILLYYSVQYKVVFINLYELWIHVLAKTGSYVYSRHISSSLYLNILHSLHVEFDICLELTF
jgi:hypothetical protein